MMFKTDIAILGGGLAGLSAGYFLKTNPALRDDYLIFERENEAGGLCRSKAVNGFIFDYDGHLLHFRNKGIEQFVKGLCGGRNLIFHKRNSWVNAGNYEIPYPFQNFFLRAPSYVAQECLLDFIKTGHARRGIPNFREWAISVFGAGIYKHFMSPYNSKFWTVGLTKLSCEWLDGFVPVPKLEGILKAVGCPGSDNIGYNSHFWYPDTGGIQALTAALIKKSNSRLHLACEAKEIDLQGKAVIFQKNRSKVKFEYLISSLPLPELPKIIPALPGNIKSATKKLKYNSIYVLNLGVNRRDISDKHWVYFPGKDIVFYRVGFPMNFSANVTPSGRSSLYAEVSYSEHRPIDKNKIRAKILKDLIKAGILRRADRILAEDTVDIKYGYPIYDANYRAATEIIIGFLARKGIFCTGRYGKWKYMSMEDTILDARKTVECLGALC